MRLWTTPAVDWQNRAHFIGLAASMMRRILVDHARAHGADKRGGELRRVSVDIAELEAAHDPPTCWRSTRRSRAGDAGRVQAKLVDCRFFGGLSMEETALALDSSPATVKREWALARAWLFRRLAA